MCECVLERERLREGKRFTEFHHVQISGVQEVKYSFEIEISRSKIFTKITMILTTVETKLKMKHFLT